MRGGKRQKRQPNQPTPCRTCPKESPANEPNCLLSFANLRTIGLYVRSRATGGRALSDAEAADAVVQRNLAIVDATIRAVEREQAEALTIALANRKDAPRG